MRPIARLLGRPLSSVTFSSIGQSFVQPPLWSLSAPLYSSGLGDREHIERNFEGIVQGAFKVNGIVFACILARQMIFSEARFQYQRLENGRPTDLFGDKSLALLERPWPNATTGELLARMEQDVSLAGNFYATVVGATARRRIRRMRPDWVTIVSGVANEDLTPDERADPSFKANPFDLRAQPVGYIYAPPGRGFVATPVVLTPEQICHWSPIPDPEAQWRGMSWLQPVIEEVQADRAATRHKFKFFENGATIGHVVTYDQSVSPETFDAFVKHFQTQLTGADKAYKTLHLGGGADVKTIGADLRQLEFKASQGAGETRIAAAARVHPVIAGFSEGLAGSSLNAGNFSAARRSFADGTIRPQWRSASAALESIVPPPASARLWVDDRDVPFMRQDAKDEAEIRKEDALTIESFIRGGFTPASAAEAVRTNDLRKLEHTGLVSVQLQPPGSGSPSPKETE